MMSLPHWCQSERESLARPVVPAPPLVLAPEPALGSHSCVALSSAQAAIIIHDVCKTQTPKKNNTLGVPLSREATIGFGVLFCLMQHGFCT